MEIITKTLLYQFLSVRNLLESLELKEANVILDNCRGVTSSAYGLFFCFGGKEDKPLFQLNRFQKFIKEKANLKALNIIPSLSIISSIITPPSIQNSLELFTNLVNIGSSIVGNVPSKHKLSPINSQSSSKKLNDL